MTLALPAPSQAKRPAPRVEYWKRFPAARRLMMLPLLAVLSLAIGAMLGAGVNSQALIMLVTVLVALPLVWRRPIIGAYALVITAAAIETYNMGFPDSLTDKIPLHKPFDQMGIPLPVTATELMMLGMLGLVALKRIGSRQRMLELGPLFPAIAAYTVFAIYGVMRGTSQGGEMNIAVWEVRAQFYIPIMYLLAYNLVTSRDQVRRVMWLFIGVVAFKGLLGVIRLVVTLHGDTARVTEVSRANSLMSHEESLLFAVFLAFGVLLFIFRATNRSQLKFIAYAAFPVLLAFLANQRRAGIMALILALLVIAVVVYIQIPTKRRTLIYVAIAAVMVMVPYTVVFRNATGIVAEPARAVLSIVRPDARDAGSNDYRVQEGENVGYNIAQNPFFGAGYGRKMILVVPMPDLTAIFSLWAYIPHNTILWVWMRLGLLGFAAFWFMVGRMMMASTISARRAHDPYLKAVAIFTITLVIAWIAQGLVDMGITDFRLNMLIGLFTGIAARIPQMDTEPAKVEPEPQPEPAPATGQRPALRMKG